MRNATHLRIFCFFGSYFFFGEIFVNQRVLLQLDLRWLKTALNSHEKCNEFADLLFLRPSLQIILPIERLFVLCHSLIRSLYFIQVYVMFNKRAGVFYRGINHEARVYWRTSKTFLEKRVSMELITMTLLWTLETSIQKKTLRMKLSCKKIKSHTCLEIFQSTNDTNRRGHSVLFQSFSEA